MKIPTKRPQRRVLSYKTVARKTFETASMLLLSAFLLFIVTLGIMLHRALLAQSEMTRYVGLIEKYNGDMNAAKKALNIISLVEKKTDNLPKDELPLVAEIKDISKLFVFDAFQSALDGDMVLIYVKSKKIFIYRPDTDNLVDEGNFDSSTLDNLSKNESTITPTAVVRVSDQPRVLLATDSAKQATESARMSDKTE